MNPAAIVAAETARIRAACAEPADPPGAALPFADGRRETLVTFVNRCLSGDAGKLRANLRFPAASAEPLPERNEGHPDLLIDGPGFLSGVRRPDGTAYDCLRSDARAPGGCDHLNE